MEIKNRKMISYTLIAFGIVIFLIAKLLKRINKMADQIVSINQALARIDQDKLDNKIVVGKLINEMGEMVNLAKKIFLTLDILKLSAPPSIANTIIKILGTAEALTPRDASITLLNNLLIEYNEVVKSLKEKVVGIEDGDEKGKVEKMIEEYQNTVSLIGTISEESSNDYISQIFNEVSSSMKKVRGLWI